MKNTNRRDLLLQFKKIFALLTVVFALGFGVQGHAQDLQSTQVAPQIGKIPLPPARWNPAGSVITGGTSVSQHNPRGTSWPVTGRTFTATDHGNYWPYEYNGYASLSGSSTVYFGLLGNGSPPVGNWYADCTVTRTTSGRNANLSGNSTSHYSCYGTAIYVRGVYQLVCSSPSFGAWVSQYSNFSTWQGTATVSVSWGAPYTK